MVNKISKLTKLWYEYVSKDHHKDRDCHWYINKVWSYGADPYYQIDHNGYVYTSKNHRHYKIYEQAERALYYDVRKAFRQEMKWAKEVVSFAKAFKGECDKKQVGKAKWLIKHYKEEE